MKLKEEIKQRKPFPNVQEEAILALMRTADQLAASSNATLKAANLSLSQYNVLRILRGAGEEGLSCGEISERMIRRDPDLTRLLDRLETRGLASRARGTTDRRVVRSSITEEGLKLLATLDEPLQAVTRETLAHVDESRLRTLIEILEEIRG